MITTTATITLHRATPEDADFVRQAFVEASNAALASSGLPADVLAGLMTMQYEARLAQWRASYPSAVQHVLVRDGEPVGVCCLAIDDEREELRVVDLAVLPEHQRQGVARAVLRDIEGRGLTVRLSVWQDDAGARALYASAGFKADGAPGDGYLELVLDNDTTEGGNDE